LPMSGLKSLVRPLSEPFKGLVSILPCEARIPSSEKESRHRADWLAIELWTSASASGHMSPLRRAQMLVSLHRHFRSINDSEVATGCFLECMVVIRQANLFHQQQLLIS
jgi:hypothetical protein